MAGARILIVEDHPTMREAMRLVLEGEGFEISEAAEGRAALDMVRSDPPDLVFLDLNMPGSNGSDVLTQIKADPSRLAVFKDYVRNISTWLEPVTSSRVGAETSFCAASRP